MARKVTDAERLLNYSYTASKDQLEHAVSVLRAALKARFGVGARKRGKASGRKQGIADTRAASAGAGDAATAGSE